MIKKSTAVLLLLLFIICTVHAQTNQPETLKRYLSLTNSFLQDGGKWIRQNMDMIPGDTSSAGYYALEFYRGINTHTLQFNLKSYLPLCSEWKIIGELLLSWNAKKQKAVLHGTGADGFIITGESELINANELHLASSTTNTEGKTEESKEVFRFKDGKIEVSSSTKKKNTWDQATNMTFTKMEQPTGNLTFMSTRDGNWEIYSMDAKGENLKNLSCSKASDYMFSHFPNSNKFVYNTNKDGNNEIYIMSADGKKQTNITNHPSSDRVAFVSPDGEKIIFLSDRDHKEGEIYIMDTVGNNLKRLTTNEYYEDAGGFSPDGKKILFSRTLKDLKDTSANAVSNGEIFMMNTDGTNEIQLTNRPGHDGGASFRRMAVKLLFMAKQLVAITKYFLWMQTEKISST